MTHANVLNLALIAAAAGSEGAAEPRVTNPPMIHNLAVAPTADCPAAQLVAAACGDGTVVVWDLDKVCALPV